MFDKLEELVTKLEEIMQELSNPDVVNDQERFRKLMKEQSDLTPIVEKYKEYRQHPDRFDVTEQGSTTVLPLTVEELRELEELVANALCGYQDKSTEDTLMDLEIKFAGLHSESATEGMRL